jgi:hypothetical protein
MLFTHKAHKTGKIYILQAQGTLYCTLLTIQVQKCIGFFLRVGGVLSFFGSRVVIGQLGVFMKLLLFTLLSL